jgi:catechol 2,3-dioxygenase-like lactoylglutathione lyase family enzyme
MSVQLNHTIVHARDPQASATFLAELLGRPAPVRFGPFQAVALDNGVTLDFIGAQDDELIIEHYAFLVSEQEFDQIFGRIVARELPYWADPGHLHPGRINHHDGGRGVYWNDPDGHYLEIITRPYGSGG